MRRSSALLVSLLLVAGAFAPIGAGAGDAAETNPRIVSMNDTANYLTVSEEAVTRSGVTADGLSLSTAIDGDSSTLQSEFIRVSFEQAFREASTDAEKSTAIRAATEEVERRHEALQRRNRAAVRAYANGSMSAAEFTRERARIYDSAVELRGTIQHITALVRADNSYSPSTALRVRLANIAGELEILQGPVSEHISRASSGETDGRQLNVEASSEGYTLAYVTDDAYVRETYLGAQREAGSPDTFEEADAPRGNAARLRGYELYPWVANNSLSPTIQGLGRSGIYRFTADYTGGELTAYIDGGTTEVFRESQRRKLSSVSVSNSITATNGTLVMRVNKTHESGPLKVELTRTESGIGTDGRIQVDGKSVGRTGPDGTLWTLDPRGTNRITATTEDNETVSLFLPS